MKNSGLQKKTNLPDGCDGQSLSYSVLSLMRRYYYELGNCWGNVHWFNLPHGAVIGIGHTPIVYIDDSVPTVYYNVQDAWGWIYCRNIGWQVVQHFQYNKSIYPPAYT